MQTITLRRAGVVRCAAAGFDRERSEQKSSGAVGSRKGLAGFASGVIRLVVGVVIQTVRLVRLAGREELRDIEQSRRWRVRAESHQARGRLRVDNASGKPTKTNHRPEPPASGLQSEQIFHHAKQISIFTDKPTGKNSVLASGIKIKLRPKLGTFIHFVPRPVFGEFVCIGSVHVRGSYG